MILYCCYVLKHYSLDGERRGTRPGQYSDAHQLFLGNLPHNASENDLRQVFERYGKVAELRVHSKSNDRCKGPQAGNNARVPNYGFITFEDQQVVTKVLNSLVRLSLRNMCARLTRIEVLAHITIIILAYLLS